MVRLLRGACPERDSSVASLPQNDGSEGLAMTQAEHPLYERAASAILELPESLNLPGVAPRATPSNEVVMPVSRTSP